LGWELGIAAPSFVGLAMTTAAIGIREGSLNEAEKGDGHCERSEAILQSHYKFF